MTREASDATKLRRVEAEVKRLQKLLSESEKVCAIFRGRVAKAETERNEWMRRFDLLLARTPESKP